MAPDIIDAGPGSLSRYYEWLDGAVPGQRVQYYLGDLAFDRDPDNRRELTAEVRREVDALNSLAKRLLEDARKGIVHLFQRKVDPQVYEYIAVLRAKPPGGISAKERGAAREFALVAA